MRLRDTGEAEFLRAVRESLGGAAGCVRLGIGDDAAVIDCPPGCSLVLTCDAAVEDRHFRREWLSPCEIGERAVRCALSDLAAMGAQPAAILLTLILSPREEADLARGLVEGAAQGARMFGACLAGGETVGRDGPVELDVVAVGFVERGRELTRAGARPGDVVMVSGTLGDSAAGLAALAAHPETRGAGFQLADFAAVVARYKRPELRLALGRLLARSEGVHAAIDLSDGLARDAGHLAEQGNVALVLHAADVPVSAESEAVATRLAADALGWALTGGEDFELLFCVAPQAADPLVRRAQADLGLAITAIGEVTDGRGVRIVGPDGADFRLEETGWDQFESI